MRSATLFLGLTLVPALLAAQAPKQAGKAEAKAPAKAAVKIPALTESQQIASAVLALPAEFRANARVLGYKSGSKELVPLREGKGQFTCLAQEPDAELHLACYHNAMEPFMARGRELRAQGVKGPQVDTVRFAEVKSGKLVMPTLPAALYQVFGGNYDVSKNAISGGQQLYVVYIPGSTAASTGLTEKPAPAGTPWIMFPGTPKAHIMLTGKM